MFRIWEPEDNTQGYNSKNLDWKAKALRDQVVKLSDFRARPHEIEMLQLYSLDWKSVHWKGRSRIIVWPSKAPYLNVLKVDKCGPWKALMASNLLLQLFKEDKEDQLKGIEKPVGRN